MSYLALQQRLSDIPEDCIDEVIDFVDFIIAKKAKETDYDCSSLFGKSKSNIDGLELQRRLRNEWN